MNSSYTGLVRFTIQPAATAQLVPSAVLPDAAKDRGGAILKFLMRDRSIKLKELTVSVDDPDALITACTP